MNDEILKELREIIDAIVVVGWIAVGILWLNILFR